MALEDEGHSGTQLGVAPTNGSSHVLGAQEPPLLELTIPELLVQTAARFPNHVAAIFEAQGIRWTYRDLIREVDALAGGLLQLGLKPGDRVGVWAPNCAEWLLAQFATARLGIILVNVNPAYRPFELSYALKKTGCTALILAAQFKNSDYVAMLSEVVPEIAASDPGALHAAELPDLRAVIVTEAEAPDGMIAFPDLIAKGRAVVAKDLDAITRKLDCHDPINIQFTSGTTGLPKGATLTHRNIVNNAEIGRAHV